MEIELKRVIVCPSPNGVPYGKDVTNQKLLTKRNDDEASFTWSVVEGMSVTHLKSGCNGIRTVGLSKIILHFVLLPNRRGSKFMEFPIFANYSNRPNLAK